MNAHNRNRAIDPELRTIFDVQERMGMTCNELAIRSGVAANTIKSLRAPNANGKHARLDHIRRLAKAIGMRVTVKVERIKP